MCPARGHEQPAPATTRQPPPGPGRRTRDRHPCPACARLIKRRLDRERDILAAVEAGHETSDSVTRAACDRDVSEVFALAEATTVAHLEKLAVEGRLSWDGTRASPVG